MRLSRFAVLWGVGLCLASGCAGLGSKPGWVQDTLYFGLSRPGGVVSEQDWNAFVDSQVTPRFPEGLTQWDARGQWRGSNQTLTKESSRVLQIVHPETQDAEGKIQAVRQEYRNEFMQESVLRVKTRVEVEL